MELRIKRLSPDAIIPTRAKPGDSGLDLHATEDVWIPSGARRMVGTGIAIELPPGYEAQVRPRSGLAHRSGVMAALGTIDNGYRGELKVNLFNHSYDSYRVLQGERIAQLVIAPVALLGVVAVEELTETERGADGFGSTGV